MAGQRVTQTPVEVVYTNAAKQRVTQVVVEVLYQEPPSGRVLGPAAQQS